jgi:phenylacetic acid degradation operon negative regulatory protein
VKPPRNTSVAQELVAQALAHKTPKAAGFIVTIYGDVVEPRGGVAWIGNLIDTCSEVGISESLVRTAVSRLVSAGQLVGERHGRRSFYRLSPKSKSEFTAAARRFFGPPEPEDWRFVHLTGPTPDEDMAALERSGYARLGPRLALGLRSSGISLPSAIVFEAKVATGSEQISSLASIYWHLAPHAAAYEAFIERFTPIHKALQGAEKIPPLSALILRLLLIHQFRYVVLHDPGLPLEMLPKDWPGLKARKLFAGLYQRLSPAADAYVATHFISDSGALSESTEGTMSRLGTLSA